MLNYEKSREKKYTQLLNNLLGNNSRRNDSAIFTKTSSNNVFDLFAMFSNNQEKLQVIFDQKKFSLELTASSLQDLISELNDVKVNLDSVSNLMIVSEKIRLLCQKYDQKLLKKYQNGLLIDDEVENTLVEIIDYFVIKQQKFIKDWTKYAKNVDDEIEQKGVSPLYLGTCFLKVADQTGNYKFNAPLFLREMEIKIEKNSVKLLSDSDWIINEKLVFYFDRMGYALPKKLEINDETSFLTIVNDTLANLQIVPFTDDDFFVQKFQNFSKEQVNNKKIEVKPGIVVGWFNPVGGYLRKLMQKIIDNNEVENIIDTNPNKSVYQEKIMSELENNYEKLVKIQELNYSQDKALISALHQDTIIWGPPGTGKSQVIANIIANVLSENKTAVVMSQKMAALNVIKKRMGKLAKFIFFSFDSKQTKKEEFYTQLNELLALVEHSYDSALADNSNPSRPLIAKEYINALKMIDILKQKNEYDSIIELLRLNGNDFDKIQKLASLNQSYYYPQQINDQKEFVETTATLNNVKKNGYIFWWKYHDQFLQESQKAFDMVNEYKINNLEMHLSPLRKTSLESLRIAREIPQIIPENSNHIDFKSDEDYLEIYLAKRIADKIDGWSFFDDRLKLEKYKKFASAIRAKRRLPEKFINDHLEIIKEFFPIIVTTPEQIFIGYDKDSFDYAIIDEASQIFLEVGLPILYLAKVKVLAGDPEQMRPTSWFATRDVADENDEEDVVENAVSLLDYAIDKGVNQILLDQNYRANFASLMSFSSKEYYKSDLEVVDKKTMVDLDFAAKSSIEIVQVNGEWNKGVNEKEAHEVVKILKENCDKYESIIVLTFNIKQKELIEDLLASQEMKLWTKVLEHKISIRNIENIQGDEADLVIVSVVYTPDTKISGTYVVREGGRNALNVSVSRAKNKMIVVKSVNANNLGNGSGINYETFKKWLYFLDLDETKQKTYSISEVKRAESYSESDFEEVVHQKLIKKLRLNKDKLKLFQQYPVGSKRIDIAVLDEDDNYLLGIEVDGYKYHSTVDKYLKDLSRENFIKSKGYDITRIKDINWHLNPDSEVKRIQNLINAKLKMLSFKSE